MSSISAMTAFWAEQPYVDVSTYTRSPAPSWLQEAYLVLFHALLVQRLREVLKGRLPLRRVVDLGCGPGDFTLRCLELGRRVTGVDVNPGFIAQARRSAAAISAAEFVEQNLLEFEDYDDCDLVCLGNCVLYLTDAELLQLLRTLTERLPAGALVYLRSSTTNPLVKSFRTEMARYRTRVEYETLFGAFGLQTMDRFHTAELVGPRLLHGLVTRQQTARRRSASPPATLQALVRACTSMTRPLRWLSSRVEYRNWILQKA